MRVPLARHSFKRAENCARFGLHQDEIAHREITDVAVLERPAKVLRLVTSQPAFTDQDVGVAGFVRLDPDAKVIGRDVIADGSGLIFHGAEQNFGVLQIPHRRLRVDVEFAQRFNVITEKLRANRPLGLPGKQIENSAANGELAARGDLRDPFVTGRDECFNRPFHGLALPATKRQDRRVQGGRIRRRLTQGRAGGDDYVRTFLALNPVEQREPFRRDFRIGQNVFDGGELGLRQEERVRKPVEQAFVKQLLRPDIWTQDPERFTNFPRDRGDEKRLGRFGHVGERDRANAVSEVAQFLRDRLRARLRRWAGDRSKNLPLATFRRIEANFKQRKRGPHLTDHDRRGFMIRSRRERIKGRGRRRWPRHADAARAWPAFRGRAPVRHRSWPDQGSRGLRA